MPCLRPVLLARGRDDGQFPLELGKRGPEPYLGTSGHHLLCEAGTVGKDRERSSDAAQNLGDRVELFVLFGRDVGLLA
jgi:hypothetical protein